MRWSYKIGQLCGIDVYVHLTFFALLAWILVSRLWHGFSYIAASLSVASVIVVFSIVVLHELGHSLAARRFGIVTRDITLLPIGGVAKLERMPEKPSHEMFVAFAGPAVNLILAILVFALQWLIKQYLVDYLSIWGTVIALDILVWLFWTNIALLAFNLIPAFPMDGGRILRAILGLRLDYLRATEISVTVGKFFALIFLVLGMVYNGMLSLIAFFIWFGGASELRAIQFREYLHNQGMEGFLSIAQDRTIEQEQQQN